VIWMAGMEVEGGERGRAMIGANEVVDLGADSGEGSFFPRLVILAIPPPA
jgi:hypothetical protein